MWCRHCHGNTKERGERNFKQRVTDKEGIVLGTYSGNHIKVLIKCKLGHQWEALPSNISACKWCDVYGYKEYNGGSTRFMRTVEERNGKVLGTYINA